jgi:dTDP-glucose 4,6-dehydratase
MARILVTGSRGVVGTILVRLLLGDGHSVFGVDLQHAVGEIGWEHEMARTDFTYSRCDVSDFRQIERVFQKQGPFDFVYHAAAEFGRWNGEDFYEQVWRTNAIGTKHIIRLQERLNFKLVHFSSSEVYGDYNDIMKEEVMDEFEIKQMNDYAMSKWVNEMQIRNSRIQYGTKTVIVRLFNTYGEGEWYHPYRSVNCKFCYHLLMGFPITVYRGHTRTSIYIEDASRTLVNIVKNFKEGEVYNIGGIENHDIETLAKEVLAITGADQTLVTFEDSEILTTKDKYLDVSKAVRDLGHKCTISLPEGLRSTIVWMRDYYGFNK